MAHPTKNLIPAVATPAAPTSQPRPGRRLIATRKVAAALSAATLLSLSIGGGPMAAAGIGVQPAAAQSVLNQAQGGSGSTANLQQTQKAGNSSGSNLNVKPNWNAPGIAQGKALIGWAKAGAVVLGVLGMIGGVVGGAVLKNAGNHHASGVRATALSIGGAMVVAGTATTLIPSLMG